MPKRVAIVGAGIGGLAAAHRLTELAAERGTALELLIFEASERAGGALATERVEGALLERGPDTLVTNKPAALALVEKVGLSGDCIFPPAGRFEVLYDGRLQPLPPGLLGPFHRKSGEDPEVDESVAARLRRRLGGERASRWVEPVLGGITMADLEVLSAEATFPPPVAAPGADRTAPPLPPLATLAGGLGQIVEALTAMLPPGALQLRTHVSRVGRAGHGYRLELAEGEELLADAVILAVPAPQAADLLRDLDPRLAAAVGQLRFASCATVHLAWPRRGRLPQSFGFFVPRSAGSPVVAASFISNKYPERVPADLFVVRAFLGGALHEQALAASDAELIEICRAALAGWLDLREPILWSHLFRQPHSMPQRTVGHLEHVKSVHSLLAAHPGLTLAGGPLGAYGLPDSIAAGEGAAERVVERMAAWAPVYGDR